MHTPPQGGLIGCTHVFSNYQFPFLKKPFHDLGCNNRRDAQFFSRWTDWRLCLTMRNMERNALGADALQLVEEILGYLNFSSGAPDPTFLKNLNDLFAGIDANDSSGEPTWRRLGTVLREALPGISDTSEAFRSVEQAEAVLGLGFFSRLAGLSPASSRSVVPPDGRTAVSAVFHRPDVRGRVAAGTAVERNRPHRSRRRGQLNDYIGHRPVAVLRTEQKIQPYDHEWVRPIPLWIRGAGVARGRIANWSKPPWPFSTPPIPPSCSTPCFPWSNSTSWPSIRGRTISTIR